MFQNDRERKSEKKRERESTLHEKVVSLQNEIQCWFQLAVDAFWFKIQSYLFNCVCDCAFVWNECWFSI